MKLILVLLYTCQAQALCDAAGHCEARVIGECRVTLEQCLEAPSVLGCENAPYPRGFTITVE